MLYQELIGRNVMKSFKTDSVQAIVATALTGHGTSHIDAIPCSPQATESILSSIP